MATTQSKRSPEELARLGAEVLETRVRPSLRPDDDGKFVAIDIASGDYEVDEDDFSGYSACVPERRRQKCGWAAWASLLLTA